jgi:hypothetical protein
MEDEAGEFGKVDRSKANGIKSKTMNVPINAGQTGISQAEAIKALTRINSLR